MNSATAVLSCGRRWAGAQWWPLHAALREAVGSIAVQCRECRSATCNAHTHAAKIMPRMLAAKIMPQTLARAGTRAHGWTRREPHSTHPTTVLFVKSINKMT